MNYGNQDKALVEINKVVEIHSRLGSRSSSYLSQSEFFVEFSNQSQNSMKNRTGSNWCCLNLGNGKIPFYN